MRYPTLSASDAANHLVAKRSGENVEVDSLTRVKGTGDEVDLSFVSTLRTEFTALCATWPNGIKSKADSSANAFEARAARLVHRSLTTDSEMLADPEFWIWLAVVHFPEVVEWRYRFGNQQSQAQLANYGIGSTTENLLYRLWLRAELVLDHGTKDRYHLCDAGQIDFYRSHLFRQGYANARNFARALLRFQYPSEDRSAPKLKTAEIRDLVKRLRRVRTNLFLEILQEDECRSVIEAEATVVSVS